MVKRVSKISDPSPDLCSFMEFLQRDEERWELARLGFWTDVQEAALRFSAEKEFSRREGESFAAWKERSLAAFYRQHGFSSFYQKVLSDRRFAYVVKKRTLHYLHGLWKSTPRTELDGYLANENESISYTLSPDHFDRLFAHYFLAYAGMEAPMGLQQQVQHLAAKEFPLMEAEVMRRLRANDQHCWTIFYRHLKPYVIGFTAKVSDTYLREEAEEMWNEVCYAINGALIGGRLDHQAGAKDLISFAVGMIRNKCKELRRVRGKRKAVDLDSVSYGLTEEEVHNPFDRETAIPEFFPSQDTPVRHYVDVLDKDSVRTTLVLALYNPTHPLHEPLVKGLEEDVALLLAHYTEGRSYEELVEMRHGPVPADEMVRLAARMRQVIRRLKTKLIQRYAQLINLEEV